jgi:hypothetical protein
VKKCEIYLIRFLLEAFYSVAFILGIGALSAMLLEKSRDR